MFEAETGGDGKPDSEGDPPAGAAVQAGKPAAPKPSAAEAIIQAREQAQAAVRTERDRVSAIQEICGGEFPRIERDAIRLGWSIEDTSQKVLKAMRENRPQADVNIVTRSDKGAGFSLKTLEAALCLRAGIDDNALVKSYGEQVVESALQSRDISLQKVFTASNGGVSIACTARLSVPKKQRFYAYKFYDSTQTRWGSTYFANSSSRLYGFSSIVVKATMGYGLALEMMVPNFGTNSPLSLSVGSSFAYNQSVYGTDWTPVLTDNGYSWCRITGVPASTASIYCGKYVTLTIGSHSCTFGIR